MQRSARVLSVSLAITLATALGGCGVVPSAIVSGTSATIAVDAEVRVLNPASAHGAEAARLGLDAALYAGFSSTDSRGRVEADRSFGQVTVLSEAPLRVRYTVADAMVWSDGVPIDAIDLLLDWAAHSGRWSAFAATEAWAGLPEALPEVSSDRKSLTVDYGDASLADVEARFAAPMPAHVVAAGALGIERPEVAKDAVLAAVRDAVAGRGSDLRRLGAFWSARFTPDAPPEVLVASGPYLVASSSDRLLELRPNPRYAGQQRPQLASVQIATLPAAEGLQALAAGEAEVLAVAPDPKLRQLVPELGIRLLTTGRTVETLVAVQRQTISGVDVGFDGRRVLWNVTDWAPAR